jgi:Flp pilus assembly secretin CpaC
VEPHKLAAERTLDRGKEVAMKTFTVAFLVLFNFIVIGNAHGQARGGAFAAAAAPGQVAPPVAPPQPTTPQAPTAARPVGQAQPAQQQQEQLRIVADPATNSLIIYGTAQEFQNIKNILKELDAAPRQVLLDVMVAEVTLTDNQSFGLEYEIFNKNRPSIFGETFGSQGAVRTGTLPAAGTVLTQFGSGMSGIIGRQEAIRAFINAAADDSRLKVLSSPSILATDNRPARIQVGSEDPIATGSTTVQVGTVASSTSIQYRNTGRIVTVIPQVNSQGLVNMQILAEVSQPGAPVRVGQDDFPSFLTRQAETTAVVQDGDTLVIGGIITDNRSRIRFGIPYLMDIPVLGRFFGTTKDKSERTELIMLITPHVIRNREEARVATDEFKSKVSVVRGELERLEQDRANQRPAPRPPELPPMPDPNRYYQDETPPPTPGSVQPGRGALAPSTAPSSGSAMVFPDPVEGRADERAGNTQVPKRSNDAVAPKPQGVALSLVPMRSEAPTASINKPDERASAAKSNRVWAVQVAALAENKDAESLAGKLRHEGYQAYVLLNQTDAKTWHRVRVGRFANQHDAQELQKTLAASKSYRNAYVALN